MEWEDYAYCIKIEIDISSTQKKKKDGDEFCKFDGFLMDSILYREKAFCEPFDIYHGMM